MMILSKNLSKFVLLSTNNASLQKGKI